MIVDQRKISTTLITIAPAYQLLGIVINNTLLYFDFYEECILLDLILGNSLSYSVILYSLSISLYFCAWHRILILGSTIDVILVFIDRTFGIPISDLKLLCLIYAVACLSVIIAVCNHVLHSKNMTTMDKVRRVADRFNHK